VHKEAKAETRDSQKCDKKKDKDKKKDDKEKSKEDDNPVKLGNFSLPTSQQPNPLVSFGQNIIDKGQLQLFLFADTFVGPQFCRSDIFPYILYGIRDDLTILLAAPFSPGNRSFDNRSDGLEDFNIQLEYVYYLNKEKYYQDQFTVVGAINFPTGSVYKNPATGFGATSFFFGLTFNRTAIDWIYFFSPGYLFSTTNNNTRLGNQFFYQAGIGRNIINGKGWMLAWFLEFDGQYFWKNKIHDFWDQNSGGNVAYLTPSIWYSDEKIAIHVGVGYPVVQNWFGKQPRQHYSINFNFAYTL
jgi:hypothetical protein